MQIDQSKLIVITLDIPLTRPEISSKLVGKTISAVESYALADSIPQSKIALYLTN